MGTVNHFWVIKTVDNERSSSYKYITTSLEDAEAHRMDYCGWYCQQGDVDIIKIDENFRELETIHYWQGKVWEHTVKIPNESGYLVDEKYLVKNGRKVRK